MLDIPLMSNNITVEDKEALIAFIRESDRFTNGSKVREFEAAWSQWLGMKYALFVNSGSSANFITMAVLRDLYGPGEVIVPPITWSSDISSVIAAGLTPVFVDVDLKNLAMREDEVIARLNEKTRAVFLTHVLGFNGLGQRLLTELEKRSIQLIEDVCESHGATFLSRKCGSFGLASNFSFYYAHHMSTIEGGMICTNDDSFYQYCRLYRSHGMIREATDTVFVDSVVEKYPGLNREFLFLVPGYNMRSTELNAVIGLNQLKRLDENNRKRCENFRLFMDNLDKDKYFTEFDMEGSSNYAFVVMLKKADKYKFTKLTDSLKRENVEFRRGTAGGGNMTRQPFVRKVLPEIAPSEFGNAEFIHNFGIYTGNYPDLPKEKIVRLYNLLNNL